MRRWLAALAVLAVAAAAAYYFLIRDRTVVAKVSSPQPAATIGSGTGAVVVSSTGRVVPWIPVPQEPPLPTLPLAKPPEGGQLKGTALEQARILGAVPPPLQPYVERSYYGKSGVDVVLTTGIELRFGDASQAPRKWRAAAALLADPSITELDYVDLHAPGRAAIHGSGHVLPPVP